MNRIVGLPMLMLSLVICAAGCHKDKLTLAVDDGQAGARDQSSDPASVNMAQGGANNAVPASYSTSSGAQVPSGSGVRYDVGPDQDEGDPGYGVQPISYSSQPPPPLPYYEQPQAPGEGYLWTPGYWGYASNGYYWVPGAWVEAPYQGALWTPGYWGYWHHRYGYYRGYWGPHIGYYGGIDYGFGYIGFGYLGGYWGGGHFNYNRAVNNVNSTVIHNVYSQNVRESNRGIARVSFNGGQGGVQMRAQPAELAARRETHSGPMSTQMQNDRNASMNRAQFEHGSQGQHPGSLAVAQPLTADHNVRGTVTVMQKPNPTTSLRQRGGAGASPSSGQQVRGSEPARYQPSQDGRNQDPGDRNAVNRTNQGGVQQHQAAPPQQQRQSAPQQQQQIDSTRRSAPQQQDQPTMQHQGGMQQHQTASPQQQRQSAPQQQQQIDSVRRNAPQQQNQLTMQRQGGMQQHQSAPPQQQRQTAPTQLQQVASPQQHQQQAPPQPHGQEQSERGKPVEHK